MAYPFFSLAKTPRTTPIDFGMKEVAIRVEAAPDCGMATIWDADILIWAASRIVAARDASLPTSHELIAMPAEILRFIGRGTSARDYRGLKAALDRLQATTVTTSLHPTSSDRAHRFTWISAWSQHQDRRGQASVLKLTLADWLYQILHDDALVLTIDPAYFGLTGGLERWLYRLVRKHAGRQRGGWKFDFVHLHMKSGSLSPYDRFAFDLRNLAQRQSLPGYHLTVQFGAGGRELLTFRRTKLSTGACGYHV